MIEKLGIRSVRADGSASATWSWMALLVAIHLVLTLPLVNRAGAGNDPDEAVFHYPNVMEMREHWPGLDIARDSRTATAPGYHYFLTTCSMVTGPSLLAMRLVTDAVSLFIPLLVFRWLCHEVPVGLAFLYTLPFSLNCFFLKASCRVVTDNPAMLLLTAALMAVFLLPAHGWRGAVAGIAGGLATFVRQLTASVFLVLAVQMVLEMSPRFARKDEAQPRPGWRDFLPALLGRMLPLVILAILYHAWHGLLPPAFKRINFNLSAAPLAYLLSVAGFVGSFFLLSLGRATWEKVRLFEPATIGAAFGGLLVALISPTSYFPPVGRWGGWLWVVAKYLPHPAERSILFMVLAPIGAFLLCLTARTLWRLGQERNAVLWSTSVLAWASSYIASNNIYHHYFEPQLMIFFAIACGLIISATGRTKIVWWPVLALLGYDLALYIIEPIGASFFHLGLSNAAP